MVLVLDCIGKDAEGYLLKSSLVERYGSKLLGDMALDVNALSCFGQVDNSNNLLDGFRHGTVGIIRLEYSTLNHSLVKKVIRMKSNKFTLRLNELSALVVLFFHFLRQ